nr:unnamed protein product [Callosobruchus analis]
MNSCGENGLLLYIGKYLLFLPKIQYNIVCSKHFLESEIITVDTITRPDSSILTCSRKIPKLQPTVIPTIFSNLPSYMTVKLPQKWKDPEQRTQELLDRDIQNFDLWMDSDKINSFDDFLSTFKTKDLCDFYFKVYEDSILFFLIDANNIPNITCSFKVKFNLEVEVYYKNLKVPSCKFEWILSKQSSYTTWSTLESLLSHLKGYHGNYIDSKEDAIIFASEFIQKSIDMALELSCEHDLSLFIKKLNFSKNNLD